MISNLPNLIIAGVHKAATTSLFTYLSSHPDIFGTGKKEIHYFTPLRYNKPLKHISEYQKYYENANGEKYYLDASPSYIYGGTSIISRMKELLPEHKVIVILRNPVDRFISYYNKKCSQFDSAIKEDLSTFVDKCLSNNSISSVIAKDCYSRALKEGNYIDYLSEWIDAYGDNLKIIYFENLISDPKSVMINLADWLEINPQPFEKLKYTKENKTVFVKNKTLHSKALKINRRFEVFFRKNRKLKLWVRQIYFMLNKKDTSKMPVESSCRNKLNSYYKEYNKKLLNLLLERKLPLPTWACEE